MNASPAKNCDRFIPYYIVAFFIFLILVLVWFVMLAIRNYPGEITHNAYTKGLTYNRALAESEAQTKLGWNSIIRFQYDHLNVSTIFTLSDKNGSPIKDAAVNAWFIRPTHAGSDLDHVPLKPDGKGTYTAKTTLAWPGEWEVHISATYQKHNYQQVKNINLQ